MIEIHERIPSWCTTNIPPGSDVVSTLEELQKLPWMQKYLTPADFLRLTVHTFGRGRRIHQWLMAETNDYGVWRIATVVSETGLSLPECDMQDLARRRREMEYLLRT